MVTTHDEKGRLTASLQDLSNWSLNPRSIKQNDFKRLKQQIQELGQYKPLLITQDGTVLGGNMRLRAYKELGITDIWVSIVDAPTEDKKLAYALSDNDRAGYYDADLLANLIPNYPEFNWEQYAVDMKEPQNLQDLIDKLTPVDEDEVPEVSTEEPISKLGEVYQLGRHRLMCGDATKLEDVEKLMDGQKADCIVTDPPYGVGIDYGKFKDTKENVKELMDKVMPILLAMDIPIALTPGIPAMWNYPKPTWLMAWIHPAPSGGCPWGFAGVNPILVYGQDPYLKLGLGRRPDSIVQASDRQGVEGHPTPKPLKVWNWLVDRLSPKANQIVFDCFGGSGSTLIACEQLNRSCYMMELSCRYIDVIIKRWENLTGQKAKLISEAN